MFPIPEQPGANALRSREVERRTAAVVGSLRAGDRPDLQSDEAQEKLVRM